MPKFNFTQTHQLGTLEAKNRLSQLVDKLKDDFKNMIQNPEQHWDENLAYFSFKIYGGIIKGRVKVEENQANMEIDYPFTLSPFRGMVEKEIRKKAKELLQ